MSDNQDALRLARELDACPTINYKPHAAELRRLHDLVTEDSILQRRQRDEIAQLGQALARAIERINELEALNAELLEALKHASECVQANYLPDKCGHDWDDVIQRAEARK